MTQIDKAVEILKKGGVVVYPTDTAYGLAVDATNLSAVKKLYKVKGRAFKKPIHVILPLPYFHTVQYGSMAKKLVKEFWPGPLTIVLPLKIKGESWKMLSAGTGTLGIRRPKHKLVDEILKKFKKPITTTSANIAGAPTTYSVFEVQKQFAHQSLKPDFYVNGGKLKKVKPSTVVLINNDLVQILREGPIKEKEIKRVLKESI